MDSKSKSINASLLQGLMEAKVPGHEVDEGVYQYVATGVVCEPSGARVTCGMYSDDLKKRLYIGEVVAGDFFNALYSLAIDKGDSFARTDYVRCNRDSVSSTIECSVAVPVK